MFASTSNVISGMLWGQWAGESRTIERNRAKDYLQSWELGDVWLRIQDQNIRCRVEMELQVFIKLQMVIKSVFLEMFRKDILKHVIEHFSSDLFYALNRSPYHCSSLVTA